MVTISHSLIETMEMFNEWKVRSFIMIALALCNWFLFIHIYCIFVSELQQRLSALNKSYSIHNEGCNEAFVTDWPWKDFLIKPVCCTKRPLYRSKHCVCTLRPQLHWCTIKNYLVAILQYDLWDLADNKAMCLL